MSNRDERWAEVAEAINDRMRELHLTPAAVLRRSGLSFKTLVRYRDGQPIAGADKRAAMAMSLGWSADSIDRILEGDSPVESASPVELAIESDPLLTPVNKDTMLRIYRQLVDG